MAKKNLSKLTKKVITDKNGKRKTVWVKMGGKDLPYNEKLKRFLTSFPALPSENEVDKLVMEKVREWRQSAGAQSVMIDDMPEEAYDKVVSKFRKEAISELKTKKKDNPKKDKQVDELKDVLMDNNDEKDIKVSGNKITVSNYEFMGEEGYSEGTATFTKEKDGNFTFKDPDGGEDSYSLKELISNIRGDYEE